MTRFKSCFIILQEKALLLGAVFLIDYMYFEQSGGGGGVRGGR